MYNDAVDGIAENLMRQTPGEGLTYMGELIPTGGSLPDGTPKYVHRDSPIH